MRTAAPSRCCFWLFFIIKFTAANFFFVPFLSFPYFWLFLSQSDAFFRHCVIWANPFSTSTCSEQSWPETYNCNSFLSLFKSITFSKLVSIGTARCGVRIFRKVSEKFYRSTEIIPKWTWIELHFSEFIHFIPFISLAFNIYFDLYSKQIPIDSQKSRQNSTK